MNKQQIEYISTADLIPYARNSRTHSEQQVSQIAASIKEFGFTNPVLIDNDNGIIAGHGCVIVKNGFCAVPSARLFNRHPKTRLHYRRQQNRLKRRLGR